MTGLVAADGPSAVPLLGLSDHARRKASAVAITAATQLMHVVVPRVLLRHLMPGQPMAQGRTGPEL